MIFFVSIKLRCRPKLTKQNGRRKKKIAIAIFFHYNFFVVAVVNYGLKVQCNRLLVEKGMGGVGNGRKQAVVDCPR